MVLFCCLHCSTRLSVLITIDGRRCRRLIDTLKTISKFLILKIISVLDIRTVHVVKQSPCILIVVVLLLR